MIKVPALTQEDRVALQGIIAHRSATSSKYPVLAKLEGRLLYVLEFLESETKDRFDWFDYDTITPDFRGFFDFDKYKEDIGVYINHEVKPSLDLIYYTKIPFRFLFEDFEQEMKDTIDKARLEFKNEKEHRQALIDSIKSKLTQEEMALIRFHVE